MLVAPIGSTHICLFKSCTSIVLYMGWVLKDAHFTIKQIFKKYQSSDKTWSLRKTNKKYIYIYILL